MPAVARCIIYVRLSSYSATDNTLSPEDQEARCRAYAAAHGLEVVRVVRDLNVSGSDKGLRLDRPGLVEVREAIASGAVSRVVFARLDRLARNVRDFVTFADDAKAAGVALVSVAEGLDLSTPFGNFAAQVLAAFAEMEAAVIAERGEKGRAAKIAARRWVSSVAPYGYVSVPHPGGKGRGLALAPAEVKVLKECADRILRGEPTTAIARDLNARSVPRQGITPDTGKPSRKPGKWTASTLARIFRGEAILGHMVANGAPVLDPATGLPEVVWEPALDAATVGRVRAALDSWSEARSGWSHAAPVDHRPDRLLSGGAIVCGSCLRPMRTATLQGDDHYRCHSRGESIPCPAPSTVLASKVEAHVAGEFLAFAGSLPVFRVKEGTDHDAMARLRAARAALEGMGHALAHEEDPAAFAALLARRTALLATVKEATEAVQRTERRVEATGRTTAEEWADGGVLERRALLRDALDCVIVRPIGRGHHRRPVSERLEVRWGTEEDAARDLAAQVA